MTEPDPQTRALLALPHVRRLVASVLAVAEKAADDESATAQLFSPRMTAWASSGE